MNKTSRVADVITKQRSMLDFVSSGRAEVNQICRLLGISKKTYYYLKMAIDGCIMNKFKCLIVNCHHQ